MELGRRDLELIEDLLDQWMVGKVAAQRQSPSVDRRRATSTVVGSGKMYSSLSMKKWWSLKAATTLWFLSLDQMAVTSKVLSLGNNSTCSTTGYSGCSAAYHRLSSQNFVSSASASASSTSLSVSVAWTLGTAGDVGCTGTSFMCANCLLPDIGTVIVWSGTATMGFPVELVSACWDDSARRHQLGRTLKALLDL